MDIRVPVPAEFGNSDEDRATISRALAALLNIAQDAPETLDPDDDPDGIDTSSLIGFGSFSFSKRTARSGRNPQTGKEIKISARNVVRFKAGSELSDKVN